MFAGRMEVVTYNEHWVSAFNNGNESIEDKPHPGSPRQATTSKTIAKIKEMVIEDPHATIRELVNLVGIFQE
ncbi:4475_t:CDS:2 [Cetraspora pellucida]|uniref:4475_t:CDS:1 n=1 Tax=Cetraspora pellucida TaxID=1433469 RepID=A0A9N9NNT9_9GLOM|nr:4475_t:CDS:2 [Cetraspora pellucida]